MLIVDDTAFPRRLLLEVVGSDEGLEVVGLAATGAIALTKISQQLPDVVVLDFCSLTEGIELMRTIRHHWPRLTVLFCRSPAEPAVEATMAALAAGASDTVLMPRESASGDSIVSFATFSVKLVGKLHALMSRSSPLRPAPVLSTAPPELGAAATLRPSLRPMASVGPSPPLLTMAPGGPSPSLRPMASVGPSSPLLTMAPVSLDLTVARSHPVDVLVIGLSTGGPDALAKLFEDLPSDLGVPILIVQHMPPSFTRLLAERLSARSRIRVVEATDGERIVDNRAYIAPGDFHMTVARDGDGARIVLNQEPPENSCRPSVDALFRSIAKVYGRRVLAAVLTGMGRDGTRGAAAIVDAGGRVIVQDAASCVVPSMPNSVLAAGLSFGVVTLDQMAAELTSRIRAAAPRIAVDVREAQSSSYPSS